MTGQLFKTDKAGRFSLFIYKKISLFWYDNSKHETYGESQDSFQELSQQPTKLIHIMNLFVFF